MIGTSRSSYSDILLGCFLSVSSRSQSNVINFNTSFPGLTLFCPDRNLRLLPQKSSNPFPGWPVHTSRFVDYVNYWERISLDRLLICLKRWWLWELLYTILLWLVSSLYVGNWSRCWMERIFMRLLENVDWNSVFWLVLVSNSLSQMYIDWVDIE